MGETMLNETLLIKTGSQPLGCSLWTPDPQLHKGDYEKHLDYFGHMFLFWKTHSSFKR